ncbi:MiaB/RimO family radical SAM methylthiotransferase [Spirochaeta africana]|uniref:tRNA-2-methylthio-N(6)-dimethylallyladenosine synthase n=1 Tax=Spirochaeta africana (strain ATCC 700263 / DSM 8902 / Z-7692) TaxID=889378 RepID=H9UII2_SPIAZ|nr:MiaB/RimO family radical SAM methylthiotransferase [Spirochaeta africana]AFG37325.1 radical SAM methylthiotransferase, MiaB/RimO family [Spirochaeta africana DSM 8902]
MKYCLLHLGCQMNMSDSERIRSVVEAMGYERTESEEEADLLGIVACSVRQKAIDKVYSKISKWNDWKQERSLVTFVSGCILPTDKEKFLTRFDMLFTIQELPDFPNMLRQYGIATPLSAGALDASVLGHDEPDYQQHSDAGAERAADQLAASLGITTDPDKLTEADTPAGTGAATALAEVIPPDSADPKKGYWKVKPSYQSKFDAYIPIQNGCDKFCSFCAVPYTRGREVSRPSAEILAEVRDLVEHDYKSITLLGQNVNSYGLDRNGDEMDFPQLMREVGEIGRETGKEFWVYFTSPHPRDMTEELLEVIAEYPVLANQIHLPIQSGDDKVLIKMHRQHNAERYRQVVANVRRILPEATLFTDIIVGFTGETEEQFQNTRKAIEEYRYNMAFIAMYSPRPGAASSRWADDIDQDEKKRRLHELTEVLQQVSREHNNAMIGRTVRLLVDREDRKDGYLSGRTEGKLIVRFPVPDGIQPDHLIGSFVDVTITAAANLSMEGELIASREPAGSRQAVEV